MTQRFHRTHRVELGSSQRNKIPGTKGWPTCARALSLASGGYHTHLGLLTRESAIPGEREEQHDLVMYRAVGCLHALFG